MWKRQNVNYLQCKNCTKALTISVPNTPLYATSYVNIGQVPKQQEQQDAHSNCTKSKTIMGGKNPAQFTSTKALCFIRIGYQWTGILLSIHHYPLGVF